MTSQEMEKTMQFILDQQAKVTVKLEIVSDKIEVMSDKVERLTEDVTMLKDVTLTHSQTLDHVALILEKLIKAQGRTDQKIAKLVEAAKRTDRKLAETDKRLGRLITTVDRYIRNGRNGKK